MKTTIAWKSWLMIGVALCALPGLARAEGADPPKPADPAASAQDAAAPEAIIVTATKRAENIQTVPISIQVVSGERLHQLDIKTMLDIKNYTPNLNFAQGPSQLYIRGFGSASSNYAFDQSVSMYLDGIYLGQSREFLAPLFDVERIEVLRGPQGALLGKGTAAGAVSTITASPLDHLAGAVNAAYDFSLNGIKLDGYVTGPLTDTLSARIAFQAIRDDGNVKNVATGVNDPVNTTKSVRGSLRYAPDASFNSTLKVQYDNIDLQGLSDVSVPIDAYVAVPVRNVGSVMGSPELDRQNDLDALWINNLAIGDGTLTAETTWSQFNAFKHYSAGSTPVEVLAPTTYERFRQISQEMRFTSKKGNFFDFIVGAYFDHSEYNLDYIITTDEFLSFLTGQTHELFGQRADSWSVFGQGALNFAHNFRLLGSLRYSDTTKSAHFASYLDYGMPLGPVGGPIAGNLRDRHVLPSVTAQYDFAPRAMFYAAFGKGSKAGGFLSNTPSVVASTNPTPFTYGAETSQNFEVGVKATLLDRFLIDLTAYDTRFNGLQVAVYNAALATFITRNAASATSKGFEATLGWTVTPQFRLSSALAYTDLYYGSFPNGSCLFTAPAGCTVQDLSGTDVPLNSKWSGNVQAEYHHPIGDRLKLSALGVMTFRSSYYTSTDLSPTYGYQSAWQKYDLRVELAELHDRWNVALSAKNLTNKYTKAFSYDFNGSVGLAGVVYLDQGRSVSLTAGVKF